MENEPYDFGLRVKRLRKLKGLSQSQLAEKLNVTKETISHYENNTQTPSLKTAKSIALILNTSLDYLMGIDDAPVVRLHDLTERETKWLYETIDLLLKK